MSKEKRKAGATEELSPARVRRWVGRVTSKLEKHFGEPRADREPPLEVLIRTILSQNTNDDLRDRAYDRLREKYPTWEEVLRARISGIASAVRVCGLHQQKAGSIKRALTWCRDAFGELSLDGLCDMETADARKALSGIKGVGPKTAAVVLLFGCGREIFPVDTHCHRTIRRLGFLPWKLSREQTFEQIQPLVPRGKALSLHLNLIRFGRAICKAPRPRCWQCFLVKECRFPEKTLAAPGRG